MVTVHVQWSFYSHTKTQNIGYAVFARPVVYFHGSKSEDRKTMFSTPYITFLYHDKKSLQLLTHIYITKPFCLPTTMGRGGGGREG